MSPLDIFRLIVDVVKAGYQAARKIPRVTCDIHGVRKGSWDPDFFHDESGNTIAEGTKILTAATILLANSGSIDTTVKNAYVVCKGGKKKRILGQLQCKWMTKIKGPLPPLSGIVIQPRRIWGPETISIKGSLWNISKPPEDLEAELVIEVVSQRPIKKKMKLYL